MGNLGSGRQGDGEGAMDYLTISGFEADGVREESVTQSRPPANGPGSVATRIFRPKG
jgi:hypothetical protein